MNIILYNCINGIKNVVKLAKAYSSIVIWYRSVKRTRRELAVKSFQKIHPYYGRRSRSISLKVVRSFKGTRNI